MTSPLRTLACVPPFAAMLAATLLALVSSQAVADEPSANPTTMAFTPGGTIRMSLHVGTMEVVGVDEPRITVSWHSKKREEADVKVKLARSGATAATLVVDGPGNDMDYRIEVPRQSSVAIHMHAGDLSVHGVRGDIDADLLAGDMDLRVAEPARYRSVRTSVAAGEITAKPWDFDTGGLFRSFSTKGDGEYDLRAHVLAGQLTIRAE